MQGTEMLVAILIPLSFFLLIFGIIYMYKRENLAMIEKGMNPKELADRPVPYKNLKWGLLLIGAGAGLFLAYMIDHFIMPNARHEDGNVAIYFSLIAIGGGLGLFGSYKVEKKWWDDNETKRERRWKREEEAGLK
ncbi:MAG: hypothetical protein J7527_08075 [Chitinophagaceae bacterium]|nr:hypothetical protein [Chitinophagaceae bacterium]